MEEEPKVKGIDTEKEKNKGEVLTKGEEGDENPKESSK